MKQRLLSIITSLTGAVLVMVPLASFAQINYDATGSQNTSVSVPGVSVDSSANANANGQMKTKPREINGTVSAVSGTNITVTTPKGETFTVDAENARMLRRFGAATTSSAIQTNDKVAVRGTVSGSAVTAMQIRDLSLQARNGAFTGTVSATNGTSFTLESKARGTQTVNTTETTKIRKNGKTATLADITIGATVTVSGVWDRTNKNVTATAVVIVEKMNRLNVRGTISAKTDTTLTITDKKGTSYSVDLAKARLMARNRAKATLDAFNAGDTVLVQGMRINQSTTINASIVVDESLKLNKKVSD